MATRTMFSFVLFVLKPWLTFVREHGNSERILDASVVVKLLPTLKQNTLLTSTPTKVLQDCECSLLESDLIFVLFFILSAGLLLSFHRHSYPRSFAFSRAVAHGLSRFLIFEQLGCAPLGVGALLKVRTLRIGNGGTDYEHATHEIKGEDDGFHVSLTVHVSIVYSPW